MTKKPRIMLTLEPRLLEFIDAVVAEWNGKNKEKMTRSRFVSLCVLAYAYGTVDGSNLSEKAND